MGEDRWNEEEVRRPPLFSDKPLFDEESDAVTTERPRGSEALEALDTDSAEAARQRLRFDDSGPLPAWTEPPTGEIGRTGRVSFHEDPPLDEGVDVWTSFTGENPIWGEGHVGEDFTPTGGISARAPRHQSAAMCRRVILAESRSVRIHRASSGAPHRPRNGVNHRLLLHNSAPHLVAICRWRWRSVCCSRRSSPPL
jgi:hypothetical protein